jgi:AcrR family transcriptional regulator
MSDAVEKAPVKPNRMDRRRMATRDKLLKATLALVVKKGVDKTTMDDITEAADLGRRTLYYHFGSKEDCVIAAAVLEYRKSAELADQAAHKQEDPALAVAVAARLVTKSLFEAPVTARLVDYPRFLAAAIKQSIEGFIDEDIEIGVEQGRFNPGVSGPMLYTSIVWTLVGFLIEAIDTEQDVEDPLVTYTQVHLGILGLDRDDAIAVSLKAAELVG